MRLGGHIQEEEGRNTEPIAPTSLCVRCELYAHNQMLAPSIYTKLSKPSNPYVWEEWVTFPNRICDVPLATQLALTVLDVGGPLSEVPLGGIVFPLFGKRGALRRGTKRLSLWRHVAADPCMPSSTPYRHDDSPHVAALSRLAKRHERRMMPHEDWLDQYTFPIIEEAIAHEVDSSEALLLVVELPAYELPIVYGEAEPDLTPAQTVSSKYAWIRPQLFAFEDFEATSENVIESKHRRLVRGQHSDALDRERKPTADVRDTLHTILAYPPTRILTPAEKDLIWAFRFYLTRQPVALTKFIKSVVWDDPPEAKQATEELLPMWAEPQLAEILELLGPSFLHLPVRAYAVRHLHRTSNDQLELYLLQLVQALKFDEMAWNAADDALRAAYTSEPSSRLVDLLCERGAQSHVLGTKLYWYVSVERIDGRYAELFAQADRQLHNALERHNPNLLAMLKRQRHFVHTLTTRNAELRASRDARPRKIEKMRALLADRKMGLQKITPPLSLPLDPDVCICGVIPDDSTIFKSNLFPWRLEFRVAHSSSTYTTIVKNGDDLRQDQLVLQLFALMNRLLLDENLDVRITPYHVLATSPQDGLVQFIPSMSVAAVVAKHGDLLGYMRSHYPDQENAATFHVQASVLDTFVRSCGTCT